MVYAMAIYGLVIVPRWFMAELHTAEIRQWASEWSGERYLHLADIFSISQGLAKLALYWLHFSFFSFSNVMFRNVSYLHCGPMRKQWRRAGFVAKAYDIKSSPDEDLVTRRGFLILLGLMLASLG